VVTAGVVGNVILTGFMGTGKSTVGRAIADELQLDFVDTDALIEERHGSVASIFAEQGEAAFRDIEHELAVELAQRTGLVISTGGAMMLDERNADALDTTGTVFCLTASVDALVDRLLQGSEHSKRPLLHGDDPRTRIESLLTERAEGYGQFTQIDTTNRSVDAIINEIIEGL